MRKRTTAVLALAAGLIMSGPNGRATPNYTGGFGAGSAMGAMTNDFAANDTLIISALAFKNRIGFGRTRLELDYDNDGVVDAEDDKTIAILGYYSYGGPGDNCALDQTIGDKILDYAGTRLSIY